MGDYKGEAHTKPEPMDRLQAVPVKEPVRPFFYPTYKNPIVSDPENIKGEL